MQILRKTNAKNIGTRLTVDAGKALRATETLLAALAELLPATHCPVSPVPLVDALLTPLTRETFLQPASFTFLPQTLLILKATTDFNTTSCDLL